jgi:hypothetical protein
MPLTGFQRRIARLISANRRAESYVAGGAVLNRADSALRISKDLDIFHDDVPAGQGGSEIIRASAERDARLLEEHGYAIAWQSRRDGHHKATVRMGDEFVRIDWTIDSAFRFFPAQPDEDFGYSLHPADLATNKVLALVGRIEVRDLLDVLQLDNGYLSFGALVWAACGKDPGYAPSQIINLANIHSRYQQADLMVEQLTRQVDIKDLKKQWIDAKDRATNLIDRLPSDDLGCLYLDQNGSPVTPDPSAGDFHELVRHRGSVRGAMPHIS